MTWVLEDLISPVTSYFVQKFMQADKRKIITISLVGSYISSPSNARLWAEWVKFSKSYYISSSFRQPCQCGGSFNAPLIVSTAFTGNIFMCFTCLADKFNQNNIEFRHDRQKHMFATPLIEEAKWRYSFCSTPISRALDWRAPITGVIPVSKSRLQ